MNGVIAVYIFAPRGEFVSGLPPTILIVIIGRSDQHPASTSQTAKDHFLLLSIFGGQLSRITTLAPSNENSIRVRRPQANLLLGMKKE